MSISDIISLISSILSFLITIIIFTIGFVVQKKYNEKENQNSKNNILNNLQSTLITEFMLASTKMSDGNMISYQSQINSNYIDSKIDFYNYKNNENSKNWDPLKFLNQEFVLLDINVETILNIYNIKAAALDKYFANPLVIEELNRNKFCRRLDKKYICVNCEKVFDLSFIVKSLFDAKEKFKSYWISNKNITDNFFEDYSELMKKIREFTKKIGFGLIFINDKVFNPNHYLINHENCVKPITF